MPIFNVSKIKREKLDFMGFGKDLRIWAFDVTYGIKKNTGSAEWLTFKFSIPRRSINNSYKEDLKECGIVVYENHPFVFYELTATEQK